MSTSVMPSRLASQCPFEKHENALLLLGFSKNMENAKSRNAKSINDKPTDGTTAEIDTMRQTYYPSYQQNLNRMVHQAPSSGNYQSLNHLNISPFEGNNLTPMVARAIIPDYMNTNVERNEKNKSTEMQLSALHNYQDDIFKSDSMNMKDDLANALLTSSLVLHSVTHTKKRPSTSDLNNAKHKRGVLLPPSSKVSNFEPTEDACDPESLKGNMIIESDTKQNQSPTITPKVRKSSAERYRQRNHRRKQFFGDKLVRVVELLGKYRTMVSEGNL